MGMVGQLYVRPRQNRVPVGHSLYSALTQWETPVDAQRPGYGDDARRARRRIRGLRAGPQALRLRHRVHLADSAEQFRRASHAHVHRSSTQQTVSEPVKYAYNDGDGSTYYDVEYPLQIHGFDPDFHFVGMTFNPESFSDMKDKYFTLNGRSYPDTVGGHVCGDADRHCGAVQDRDQLQLRQWADGGRRPDGDPVLGRHHALLAAAAERDQHSGERQGAAAHFGPRRHRVSDAGVARHPDESHRPQCAAAARHGGQQPRVQHELDHSRRAANPST